MSPSIEAPLGKSGTVATRAMADGAEMPIRTPNSFNTMITRSLSLSSLCYDSKKIVRDADGDYKDDSERLVLCLPVARLLLGVRQASQLPKKIRATASRNPLKNSIRFEYDIKANNVFRLNKKGRKHGVGMGWYDRARSIAFEHLGLENGGTFYLRAKKTN